MKVIKVTKEYFETEDEKVYFFEPLEKEISVEDMQKIVDAKDATIAALRAEVERLKVKLERWKIPHTIEELTEMKEQSNQPSLAAKQAYINALEWHFSESRARAEQAEKELVAENEKLVKELRDNEHSKF